MSNFFNIMAAPFAECLVLVGIHAYLGIHVLKRRIIFVDLALAQIAALGTTVGILFGIHDTDSVASFAIAMGFTFVGAAVFAISRVRSRRVPQEAVIGLVYAITAAVAVLVVGKSHGMEHLVNIMHGRLLWVQWAEVGTAAVAYVIIGVVHVAFRKQFMRISEDPEGAFKAGMPVRLWDFFFYMTFGYTISFSVRVAGVLLVFVFLVAPAIIALLLTDRLRYQLAIGWIVGTVVSSAGIYLSWMMDTPCGPTVVSSYAVVLVVIAVFTYLARAENKGRALGNVGMGLIVVAVLSGAFYGGGKWLASTNLGHSGHGHHQLELDLVAAGVLKAEAAEHGHHDGEAAAGDPGDAAAAQGAPADAGDDALSMYRSAETCLDRAQSLEQILEGDQGMGLELTYLFLADGETMPFCRNTAVGLLTKYAGEDFGFDPDGDPLSNMDSLHKLRRWIDGHAGATGHSS
jgi:zinc/manganese transport system permease protein